MNFLQYIQGSRKGRAAHDLELEAMRDPFMSDAIDGVDNVRENHIKVIEKLQRQITAKSKAQPNHLKAWSIAAAILVAVGASTFFLIKNFDFSMLNNKGTSPTALAPLAQAEEKESAADSFIVAQEDSNLVAMKQAQVVEEQETTQPVVEQIEETADQHIEETVNQPVETPLARQLPAEETIVPTDQPAAKTVAKVEAKVEAKLEDTITATDNGASIFLGQETTEIEELPIMAMKQYQEEPEEEEEKQPEPKIKGKVTTQDGKPIVGASVLVAGTGIRTYTEPDGSFELSAQYSNYNLIINYIGYDRMTVTPQTNYLMQITMKEKEPVVEEKLIEVVTEQQPIVTQDDKKRSTIIKTPKPVDGDRSYRRYLEKNMVRPSDECANTKGDVRVTFQVNEKGRPYNIKVTQGLCPSADKEAIRLIQNGPSWTPDLGYAVINVQF